MRWGIVALAALAVLLAWQRLRPPAPTDGLFAGNGRIEAVEIDVAAKSPGRIRSIAVNEGDFVAAGQIVAHMDTDVLNAQRRQADAQWQQAQAAVATAESQVAQRESERAAAEALLGQREAELDVALKRLARTETLAREGAAAIQQLDDDRAHVQSAHAAISAARAQIAAATAAIATAKAQVLGARSAVQAAQATVERIQADIDDSALKAPRDGRVQYRVAQPGEVVGAGSRVLNLIDLSDVYMTFFLPTAVSGKLAIGSEARLVLDAAPQYVIPASISFVADVAQFTPKTVETASERQKLMFRVKARVAPELLKQYMHNVKTGLPGMAYVRTDATAAWPAHLQIRLPQ